MMCGRCHIRESEIGKKTCLKCLIYLRKFDREKRIKRIAAGYCIRCRKKPRLPGLKNCQRCVDWSRQYVNRQRKKHINAGLCYCGRARIKGKKLCERCRQIQKGVSSRKKRRCTALGLCVSCGKKVELRHIYCEKHLKYRKERSKQHLLRQRKAVISHYGGKCFCCGLDDIRFLTIDHISGCGRTDRKEHGFGSSFYNWLIKNNFPEGFRVACTNCNSSRGMHGYCPHRPKDKIIKKLDMKPRNLRARAALVKRRALILDHYDHRCACCGESRAEFLTIDHINGGGLAHRRSLKMPSIDRWLIAQNFPEGFQLLCWNCNLAKMIYRVCPHKA